LFLEVSLDIAVSIIVPLLAGLVPALLTYLATRHKARAEAGKIKADTAETITLTAGKLIDELREEMGKRAARQGQEIAGLRSELEAAQRRITEQDGKIAEQDKRIAELVEENEHLRVRNHCLLAGLKLTEEGANG